MNKTDFDRAHAPNVFDTFYADPTPANAIALAVADHQAYCGQASDEFTTALRKAETQCNAHKELVALLRDDVLPVVTNYRALHDRPLGCICIICELPGMIRAALAKVGAA